ncbi:MAG: hypothetical protein ABFS45_17350 [Pseudomonadota bacterium]
MNSKSIAGTACGLLVLAIVITFSPPWSRDNIALKVSETQADNHSTAGSRILEPEVTAPPIVGSWTLPSFDDRIPDSEVENQSRLELKIEPNDEIDEQIAAFDVAPILEPSPGEIVNYNSINSSDEIINGQPSRDQIASNLDIRFFAEAYEGGWASETEAELNQLFAETGLEGSQLMEAACRTTLCRIDVTHADSEAEERFIATFANNARFVNNDQTGFYHRRVDYNGIPQTLFFWARQGHILHDP